MKLFTRKALVIAAAVLSGAGVLAHIRLQHPSNGNKLVWSSPANVSIVISSIGSDDISDGSHITALRNAIDAWNRSGGTTAHLTENTSPAQMARTDWAADDLHLIFFDESDSSGYFPVGSGTVALTPLWFASSGAITDGDVLFNGSNFNFTTSKQPGQFDVQDVATHELGHFLGLDHSGWAGASMYPYVDPSVILHRSLSEDDVRGVRDMYPSGSYALISGTVRRAADSSVIAGAHVVARDANGRPYAGALATDTGTFQLKGLAAGTYGLYVSPLDYPVSSANLGNGHTVQTDFASKEFAPVTVTAGQSLSVGDLLVDPDVVISLGRNSDDYPLRVIAGATQVLAVHGTGLTLGSTLASSDLSITVGSPSWLGSQVNFAVTVPSGAAPGHVDLTATNLSGDKSILTAALEITPPDPSIASVTPGTGSHNGGTAITISGANFTSGARVVLGANVYVDGDAGGCTVVDPSTITLTTAATTSGTCDVVVIDPTGVEGRSTNAFQFDAIPMITSLFPLAGSASGGTQVVIRGSDFDPACTVTIDGVVQTQVTIVSSTKISVLTSAGVPGGPYVVEVQNPGGSVADAAYSYALGNDPSITSIDPASGKSAGGETITIYGANFQASTSVYFGADADTGAGGVVAASITFIDAMTLMVVTPAHSSGVHNVLAKDDISGQASVMPSAFTFISPSGGGGGGCSVSPLSEPKGPLSALSAAGWMLALFAILTLRARRARSLCGARASRPL